MSRLLACSFVVMLTALTGCASGDRLLYPRRAGQEPADLIVLDNHWHTALIVRQADLREPLRSDLNIFADYRYVAIGWGDQDFFRADHVTSGLVPQAMFYSRGSVLLVIGFDSEPEETFDRRDTDIYRIPATRAGLDRAIDHAARSFRRDADGRVIDGGPGPGDSRFYIANGRYGWNHTCNQWTAAALKNAGLPITPAYAATAWNVEYQIRQLGGVRVNSVPLVQKLFDRDAVLLQVRGGRR